MKKEEEEVIVVVAHIYPPVTGQRQMIQDLFLRMLRPKRVCNFTQWSDMIYDKDMDLLLNQVTIP